MRGRAAHSASQFIRRGFAIKSSTSSNSSGEKTHFARGNWIDVSSVREVNDAVLLFRRNLSTTSPTTGSAENAAAGGGVTKPKRKKKNLFEVAQFLPNWGIGYHMAKKYWNEVSYEITKINLYKDGRHGKAWGIAYKNGVPAADAPKKISGVHKRCWKYIPNFKKKEESGSKPDPQAD